MKVTNEVDHAGVISIDEKTDTVLVAEFRTANVESGGYSTSDTDVHYKTITGKEYFKRVLDGTLTRKQDDIS